MPRRIKSASGQNVAAAAAKWALVIKGLHQSFKALVITKPIGPRPTGIVGTAIAFPATPVLRGKSFISRIPPGPAPDNRRQPLFGHAIGGATARRHGPAIVRRIPMTPQSKASELSTSPTFWQTHSRHISSDLLGADVIKTEDPNELDKSRDSGTDNDLNHAGMGIGFLTQGSDKRAITLDLKTEEGRTILKKLAATADVLLDENFLLQ
jgi:CoA-transferase family III